MIVQANGRRVRTPGDLRRALESVEPGDEVTIAYNRGDDRRSARLETVASRQDPEQAAIGVFVSQEADIELPLNVKIDTEGIGGPSAGLPFALEILEKLGRDVDKGLDVAATGEIELDGTVAPVGGLKQKTIGAKEAGVDVFLVPAGENAAEARRHADGMRIVPVRNFQQALRVTGNCGKLAQIRADSKAPEIAQFSSRQRLPRTAAALGSTTVGAAGKPRERDDEQHVRSNLQ